MIDVFAALPGRGAGRSRAADRRSSRESVLVDSRRRIRLLDLFAGTRAARRALSGGGGPRSRARSRPSASSMPSRDHWPQDLAPPLVKAALDRRRASLGDDVLEPRRRIPATLRQIAAEVENEIKTIPEVSDTALIGGLRRRVPSRARSRAAVRAGLARGAVLGDPRPRGGASVVGALVVGQTARCGSRLADSCGRRGARRRHRCRERRPARAAWATSRASSTGRKSPSSSVTPASRARRGGTPRSRSPVSKRRGANATALAQAVLAKVEALRPRLLPADVRDAVTRNYGETPRRSRTSSSSTCCWPRSRWCCSSPGLGLAQRASCCWPCPSPSPSPSSSTLALGYTLNRVTLFALIFSIGILVDDAIVVVENIERHQRRPTARGPRSPQVAVEAVDEVGNPTILATFTVIAAILPMAFVRGLMGPYMRPDPDRGLRGDVVLARGRLHRLTLGRASSRLPPRTGRRRRARGGSSARLYRRVMARS